MNELMVIIGGRQWIYYATDQITADKAFQEFTEKCETSGFNFDNVDIFEVSLRDKNGNEIDQGCCKSPWKSYGRPQSFSGS